MASGKPSLEEIRAFWDENPVADRAIGARVTLEAYFRAFDKLRESPEVEPYAFSNLVHDYEGSAGKRVLDYGCGNGYVLAQYVRNGAEAYGVDLTETAIRLARSRFELAGLEGTFVQNDGVSIPFESDFFDVACSMGVLHHIPDPRPVVAELQRVLKPGGRLVVMLYHRGSYRYRVAFPWLARVGPARYRGRSRQEVVNLNDGEGNPWGTVYSRREARELLREFEAHRFWVRKLTHDDLALYSPRLLRFVSIVPGRAVHALGRRIGWNLYCVARKPG